MYPTLYHAVLDLLGLDLQALKLVNMFGFMVALGFLGAARSLALELERKHAQGKLQSSQRKWVPPRPPTLLDVGFSGLLAGLLGFKLFHLLERPKSILELFEHPSIGAIFSGLTIYGGVIMGTLFVYRYSRRHNLTFPHVADSVAPGLLLGYAIGRLGCQLSGDGDWGIASKGTPAGFEWLPSWFFSFDYPNNVLGSGVPMPGGGFPGYGTHLVPPVYPTPLYESMAAFALFALLWGLRKRIERPLVMFGLYMVVNGIERFLIEQIRVNAVYEFFGKTATQAEIIAVCMFVGGLALIFYQMRKPLPVLAVPKPAETPATTE